MTEEQAERETESGPDGEAVEGGEPSSTQAEGADVRDRMARRVLDRRLEEWLDSCDPELTVLCVLIAQNQFFDTDPHSYAGGELERLYGENPDRLLAEANLPEDMWETWKVGRWDVIEKYFTADFPGPSGLPAERGFP